MNKNVEKILLEFDPEVKNLLPVLKKISTDLSYIDQVEAEKVSRYFSIPLAKVYETASFYDLIKTRKQPGLLIQVCSGANCAVKSAYKIIREIEDQLHIRSEDEFNSKIRLEVISCLGQCGSGPIVVINGKVFTSVSPDSISSILKDYL